MCLRLLEPSPLGRGAGDADAGWQPLAGVTPGRVVTEVRFFVPGPGPTLAEARRRRRRDRYHLASLTPERSFKLRGRNGKGELKVLTARVAAVEVAESITAEPEQWAKLAVHLPLLTDDWIEVAKEIWQQGPVEITSIDGDLGRWWTLAVQVGPSGCPRLPDEVSHHLMAERSNLRCRSYAAWLTESLGLDRAS